MEIFKYPAELARGAALAWGLTTLCYVLIRFRFYTFLRFSIPRLLRFRRLHMILLQLTVQRGLSDSQNTRGRQFVASGLA